MSITIHIHYTWENGSAKRFAEEMAARGIVEKVRAEAGNEMYAYYLSMDDPETVLLVDKWRDQAALDFHHRTTMMKDIADLREKHKLTMRVERFKEENDE